MKEWGVGNQQALLRIQGRKAVLPALVFPVLSQDRREESSDYQETETGEITVCTVFINRLLNMGMKFQLSCPGHSTEASREGCRAQCFRSHLEHDLLKPLQQTWH